MKRDGGFVAGFGYTVLPYLAILRIYQDALFAAFAGSGDPRLGLAWQDCLHGQAEAASSGSFTHLRQHLALTLLGDPALTLWPSGPTEVADPDVPADQPLASAASSALWLLRIRWAYLSIFKRCIFLLPLVINARRMPVSRKWRSASMAPGKG